MSKRSDQRRENELRKLTFVRDFQLNPLGSVMVSFGRTRVLCSVSVENRVPRWMREQNVPGGWLTSEYQMLPGSTPDRSQRDVRRGSISGRSSEIQRLIGRSLRATLDLEKLPAKTFYVDCDVVDADGGTRCASICGASVALEIALRKLYAAGEFEEWPMNGQVSAVSVGIVDGTPMLDLCYEEDSNADVDMNVVMLADGNFVEVQGSAEKAAFSGDQLDELLALAKSGMEDILNKQREAVEQ